MFGAQLTLFVDEDLGEERLVASDGRSQEPPVSKPYLDSGPGIAGFFTPDCQPVLDSCVGTVGGVIRENRTLANGVGEERCNDFACQRVRAVEDGVYEHRCLGVPDRAAEQHSVVFGQVRQRNEAFGSCPKRARWLRRVAQQAGHRHPRAINPPGCPSLPPRCNAWIAANPGPARLCPNLPFTRPDVIRHEKAMRWTCVRTRVFALFDLSLRLPSPRSPVSGV